MFTTREKELHQKVADKANTLFENGLMVEQVYSHFEARNIELPASVKAIIDTEWVLRNQYSDKMPDALLENLAPDWATPANENY